jgi:outer membrane protein assembly factor BamB
MTIRRSIGLAASFAVIAVALGGCLHINNPFAKGTTSKYTGKGERISVIAFDDKLSSSDTLKGVDFYLPDAQPVASWPLPGGTPEQSLEHVDAARDFAVAWRSKFGRGSNRQWHITAPPVAADGRVYVMDGSAEVSAHDLVTGREVWSRNLAIHQKKYNHQSFGGGVAYDAGKLFVSSGYRLVAALDAATGKVLWQTQVDAPIHAAPTVAGGRVIVESTDDNLMTFDEATGAQGWAYQALNESARILQATSPAVSGDAVVASFASGELVALQITNGNGLWTNVLSKSNRNSALSEIRDIPGRPVIFKGDVYAVSHSGLFASIELRTGAEHWSIPITAISSPWLAGDVAYVTDTSGQLICVARESGQVYWIIDLNKGAKKPKDRALWSGPVLAANRLVVVSSKGEARALNPKTGAFLKSIKLGSEALMNPIAADGRLYVATQNAELIAIR